MIQIPWRRVAGAALVMCLLLANTSYAETTQDNINDAKNQIEDLKDQKRMPRIPSMTSPAKRTHWSRILAG